MNKTWTITALALLGLAGAGFVAFSPPKDPDATGAPEEPGLDGGRTAAKASRGAILSNDREEALVGTGGTPVSDRHALSRIRVFVHLGDGMPVAHAGVILSGGRSAKTGDDGSASFDVPPGSYIASVNRKALPRGITASTLQGTPPPNYEVPEGYYGQVVQATAGQTVETRLRVFASATISGMVLDAAGAPLEGVHVRAQCRAAGLNGYAVDAKTRFDGLYVLEGILPNVYTIEAHPARGGVLPVRFEVLEGVAYTLEPLVVGGNGAVRGRVIDQDGAPCAKVPVVAYACEESVQPGEVGFNLSNTVGRVETSATGTFRLEGLPIGRLRVQVHPEGALIPDGDGTRLVRPPEAFTVDLRQGARAQLGDVKVERSRPFRLRLRVDLDERAVRRMNPTLPSTIHKRVFVAREPDLRDESKWTKLSEDDGRYLFRCETPSPSLWVIVRISGVPDKIVRFEPEPFGVIDTGVSYP